MAIITKKNLTISSSSSESGLSICITDTRSGARQRVISSPELHKILSIYEIIYPEIATYDILEDIGYQGESRND